MTIAKPDLSYGFRNWGHGNAMHAYYTDGTTGRFLGWWSVMLYVPLGPKR